MTVSLPPGVPDLDTWGRTVIDFGLLKGANVCYLELYQSEAERLKSYVKWVKGRITSADAQLLDLAKYLRYIESPPCEGRITVGPLIPGTESYRSYK